MMYTIYYKHTFECDTVFAFSKKQAEKKALAILIRDFEGVTFPLNGHSYGENFIANSLEDLIEEISGKNILRYCWELWFGN